jgi:NDP-sugar pyrophosphorylase family protein
MLDGVSLIDPNTIYIEPEVIIGQDTVIWPNTYLHGSTRIGEGCTIGPNSILRDTLVGDRCRVLVSVTEKAILEDDVEIGPFAACARAPIWPMVCTWATSAWLRTLPGTCLKMGRLLPGRYHPRRRGEYRRRDGHL